MILAEERRAVLSRLSDGSLHDLYAWPITDEVRSLKERLKWHFAMGMLQALGQIQVVEESDDHMWAQITEAGRQALRRWE